MSIIISTDSYGQEVHGVILEPQENNQIDNDKSDYQEKYWIPNKIQVDKLEETFPDFLQSRLNFYANERKITEIPKQSEYFRQYVGVYRENQPVIMIRGHRNNNPDINVLKHDIYFILDGGWYLFTAYYNPETNKLINFSFNDGSS